MSVEGEIRRLYGLPKTLATNPAWHYDDDRHECWRLDVPISINYVTEEGFYLLGSCLRDLPDRNVAISLVYRKIGVLSGPIERLDWNPTAAHRNAGRGPSQWKWKPITVTHLHAIEMNLPAGWERMARGNLPIARPVEDPLPTFRDMLDFLKGVWDIRDIQRIPPPEWSPRLA